MKKLSDAQIARAHAGAQAPRCRTRLEGAEPQRPGLQAEAREALEPAVVPAFALVREAGRRTLGMRHFDVQLIGGIVLHQGKIAEMKTGEGKTLVATLARLSEFAHRQGRAYRHRERLSGPPRRGMDGPDLQDARALRSA